MRFVKNIGKSIICLLLERQVKKLRKKHSFNVIAIAGSVGKTSTKLALAKTLSANMKVLWQEGNYNDRLTVPLIFFGHEQPGLFNVFAWTKILIKNVAIIGKTNYGFDIVVVELGTDGPGQMKKFKYIKPDICVITAVSSEHMEYFSDIEAVASEELEAAKISNQTLINQDDVPTVYYQTLPKYKTYGINNGDYKVLSRSLNGTAGQSATISLGEKQTTINTSFLGTQGLKVLLPAVICAHSFGMNETQIAESISKLQPFAGRLQMLKGVHSSTIIDDSYNASPSAVKAALELLYELPATHKIAIIGNMNELGKFAEDEHRKIGQLCDPSRLNLIITLGPEANEFTATEAETKGCHVIKTLSPYEAGEKIKQYIQPGSVVLVKGSQNRVFSEEAIKSILEDPNDSQKLVRQSEHWMSIKQKQFKV